MANESQAAGRWGKDKTLTVNRSAGQHGNILSLAVGVGRLYSAITLTSWNFEGI